MLDKFIIPQIEWFLKWLMFSKIKEITNDQSQRDQNAKSQSKLEENVCNQRQARETAHEKSHCLIVLVLNIKSFNR